MHGTYSKKSRTNFQAGPFPNPAFLRPTHSAPKAYFTTPMKKLMGYLLVLSLIGYCIWFTAMGMKPKEVDYEVVLEHSLVGSTGTDTNFKAEPSLDPNLKKLKDLNEKIAKGEKANQFKGAEKAGNTENVANGGKEAVQGAKLNEEDNKNPNDVKGEKILNQL